MVLQRDRKLGNAPERHKGFDRRFFLGPFKTSTNKKDGFSFSRNKYEAVLHGAGEIEHIDPVRDDGTIQAFVRQSLLEFGDAGEDLLCRDQIIAHGIGNMCGHRSLVQAKDAECMMLTPSTIDET